MLTETWLNSSVKDGELFGSDYVVYRRDRETSGYHKRKDGGGVLVAVTNRLKSTRVFSYESDCEDLWINVTLSGTLHVNICAVYLPPPLRKDMLYHFTDNFNSISEEINNVCMLGDFNLSCIEWTSISNNNFLTPKCNGSTLAQILTDFLALNNLA